MIISRKKAFQKTQTQNMKKTTKTTMTKSFREVEEQPLGNFFFSSRKTFLITQSISLQYFHVKMTKRFFGLLTSSQN